MLSNRSGLPVKQLIQRNDEAGNAHTDSPYPLSDRESKRSYCPGLIVPLYDVIIFPGTGTQNRINAERAAANLQLHYGHPSYLSFCSR